jgi:gliding motility-associated-like protein
MRLALLLLPLQIWGQVDLSLTTSETGWTVTCESGEANQIVMGIHAVGLDTAWLPGLSDVWHIGWAFASFPANLSVMETWTHEFEDVFNPNFQNLWNLRDSVCVELVIWQIDGSQTLHTWDSPYGWTNGPSAANDTPPYPDPTPWNNRVTECFCYDVVDVVYDYDTLYFPQYVIIVQTEYDTLYVTQTDTVVVTETDTLYVQQLDTLVVTDTLWLTQLDTLWLTETLLDTLLVTDTLWLTEFQTDTLYLTQTDTLILTEILTDTLWLTETDTLWLTSVDTLYLPFIDTVFSVQPVFLWDTIQHHVVEYLDCETQEECYRCDIYVPNAFTPNDDGINDRWKWKTDTSCWGTWEVSVFNRWGMLVWHTYNIHEPWTGEGAAEGVYTYTIYAHSLTGHLLTGHITLLR